MFDFLKMLYRKDKHSYKIDLKCKNEKYRIFLNPKEAQGYSKIICPDCGTEVIMSTTSFYGNGNDYIIVNDHKIYEVNWYGDK